MTAQTKKAIALMRTSLGIDNVVTDIDDINKKLKNTYNFQRQVPCVVSPGCAREVEILVNIANTCKTPLYPISKGKNIGYGDQIPVADGQILVELSRMNKIISFDNELGIIEIEPGVTQKQLYEFLEANESNFWMDATGAGYDSSIIGNSLEGGFGHTPKGNRREMISNLQVVCGNGEKLNTGDMLDFGPSLSGVFVQSNFGIITSLKTKLNRIPELYKSFAIKVEKDTSLELLVDTLRNLRQDQTLTSLVHIANATRSLISINDFPKAYENKIISCEDAIRIMKAPFLPVGYWTVIGGLYGTKEEIKAKEKKMKQQIKPIGRTRFFDEKKINRLSFLSKFNRRIQNSVESLRYVHGMGMGRPNNKQVQNIKWRVSDSEDTGLIWYSPKVAARGKDVRTIIDTASVLFKRHGFEFPVTLTMVTPESVTAVLSISFNKNDSKQRNKAIQLYQDLSSAFKKIGIHPYRHGVIGMQDIEYEPGKSKILSMLKHVFDPNNIISPGRYGIGDS